MLACIKYVYYTYAMEFEWNEAKAASNLKKHGVTFEEALSCFYDQKQVVFYDPDHSEDEDRELMIAHSERGRVLFVAYTLREDIIRIISVRKATRKEEMMYAQGI